MSNKQEIDFDDMLVRRYIRMKEQAKRRGVEFSLPLNSLRNVLKAKKCYYTGREIGVDFPSGHPNQLTVDRKNPKLGYIRGNVVAASNMANELKNSYENVGSLGRQDIQNSVILKKLEKDIRILRKMYSAIKGL